MDFLFNAARRMNEKKLDCGCSKTEDGEVMKIGDMTLCEEHHAKYTGR